MHSLAHHRELDAVQGKWVIYWPISACYYFINFGLVEAVGQSMIVQATDYLKKKNI